LTTLQSIASAIGQDAPVTPLEEAVLRTLAYSDIFDYPLTAEEIWRCLPVQTSLADVDAVLMTMTDAATSVAPYHMLAGREAIAATRERRRRASSQLMRRAKTWGAAIAALPFVRGVAITGSLAVDNADAAEDIDYLIVAKRGRVWTARAFTYALVRSAKLTGVELCPNYVVAEDALAMDESAYVARELVQMRPLAGARVMQSMLDENPWWKHYLPNAAPAALQTTPRWSPRWLQALPEAVLSGRVGDALEGAILQRKGGRLRRAAGINDEAIFDARMAKGHVDGHRGRIESALAARLERLGIST
jgi:hypothetical protein